MGVLSAARQTNVFTIDVEDWYHDETRGSGPARPEEIAATGPRVDRNLRCLLDLLESAGARATLFCLGELAQAHGGLLHEAHRRGHEIASHGDRHLPVAARSSKELYEDFRTARRRLEDATGARVEGFRAPFFLTRRADLPALEQVVEAGYRWDSSWLPLRYGASRPDHITTGGRPQRLANGLWEFPLPLTRLPSGHTLPVAGGGFTLRALPYPVTRHYLARYNAECGPAVLYTHPWEVDPDSPKLPGTPAYVRFFNGLGRSKMERKLRQLTADFAFAPIREVFANELGTTPSSTSH